MREWRSSDGTWTLAWNLREEEPQLYQQFRREQEMTVDLIFLIYTSRSQPPKEVPTTTRFAAGASEDEFWRNFYAAVRDARSALVEVGEIDPNKDEENYPPFVLRLKPA